jgi:hypothetical protein
MTDQKKSRFSESEQISINQLKEKISEILEEAELPREYKLWGIALSDNDSDQRLDVILYKFLFAR